VDNDMKVGTIVEWQRGKDYVWLKPDKDDTKDVLLELSSYTGRPEFLHRDNLAVGTNVTYVLRLYNREIDPRAESWWFTD
jgi:hypothetical protein